MRFIDSIAELESLYGSPAGPSLTKVADRLTPAYSRWIAQSRFCILATVGPGGTDVSPRGEDGPVVRELNLSTLALPDWRGNQRIDSLRNIVADGRASLMFMVAGSDNVVRVNGTARVSCDDDLRARFTHEGRMPATVVVISVAEVYFQCARALMRAELWRAGDGAPPEGLPSPGEILRELSRGEVDGAAYDHAWPGRARDTLW